MPTNLRRLSHVIRGNSRMTKEQSKAYRIANREKLIVYEKLRYTNPMRRRMQRKHWRKASAKYRAKMRKLT